MGLSLPPDGHGGLRNPLRERVVQGGHGAFPSGFHQGRVRGDFPGSQAGRGEGAAARRPGECSGTVAPRGSGWRRRQAAGRRPARSPGHRAPQGQPHRVRLAGASAAVHERRLQGQDVRRGAGCPVVPEPADSSGAPRGVGQRRGRAVGGVARRRRGRGPGRRHGGRGAGSGRQRRAGVQGVPVRERVQRGGHPGRGRLGWGPGGDGADQAAGGAGRDSAALRGQGDRARHRVRQRAAGRGGQGARLAALRVRSKPRCSIVAPGAGAAAAGVPRARRAGRTGQASTGGGGRGDHGEPRGAARHGAPVAVRLEGVDAGAPEPVALRRRRPPGPQANRNLPAVARPRVDHVPVHARGDGVHSGHRRGEAVPRAGERRRSRGQPISRRTGCRCTCSPRCTS